MKEFEYRAQFQGAAKPTGFNPIKAPDISKALEKYSKEEQINLQNQQKQRLADMQQQEKMRSLYANASVKALANFSAKLSDVVVKSAQAYNEQQLQLGLNDDLNYGIDAAEQEEYNAQVRQLEASDEAYNSMINKSGAPEEVKQEMRYATGHRGLGQKMQQLTNGGQELKNVLTDALATDNTTQIPDPFDANKSFTPVEARAKGPKYVEAAIDLLTTQHGMKLGLSNYNRHLVNKSYNPAARKSKEEVSQTVRAAIVKDRAENAKGEAKRNLIVNLLSDDPSVKSLSKAIMQYANEGGVSVATARKDIIEHIVRSRSANIISQEQEDFLFSQVHPPTNSRFEDEFIVEVSEARQKIRRERYNENRLQELELRQEGEKVARDTIQHALQNNHSGDDVLAAGAEHYEKYNYVDPVFAHYANHQSPEARDLKQSFEAAKADGIAKILTPQRLAEVYPELLNTKYQTELKPYIDDSQNFNALNKSDLEKGDKAIEDHFISVYGTGTAADISQRHITVKLALDHAFDQLRLMAAQNYVENGGNATKAIQDAQLAVTKLFDSHNANPDSRGMYRFTGRGYQAKFPQFDAPDGQALIQKANDGAEMLRLLETIGQTEGLEGLKSKEAMDNLFNPDDINALASGDIQMRPASMHKIKKYVNAYNIKNQTTPITYDQAIDTLLGTYNRTRVNANKKDPWTDAARRTGLLNFMQERMSHGGPSRVAVDAGLPPPSIRTGVRGVPDVVQTALHYKMPPNIAPLAGAVFALESGYGTKESGAYNIMGIKGTGTVRTTTEGPATNVVKAEFQDYSSRAESLRDFVDIITNEPRYKKVREAKTLEEAAIAIADAGYATDAEYKDKLIQLLTEQGRNVKAPFMSERLVADSRYSDLSTMGPEACQFITGNTGTSTGPHVHVAVNKKFGERSPIDPTPYVNQLMVGDKPLAEAAELSEHYGPRTHPVRGGYDFHAGIDYATPTGTRITVPGATYVTTFVDNSGGGVVTSCRLQSGLELLLMHGSNNNLR
jgi:hypothetical protein